jgi:diacylglycerol kinase (ATP)
MSGIGVVTNPHSRRNRHNPHLVQQLAYILGERGRLDEPASPEGMEKVAETFLDHEVDVLCINGGDGTGHVVLSAFARVYGDRPLPMVSLLRGGTMNTVASGLGVRGTPSDLLARVVRMYHEREPFALTERNLLCVDDRYYGFLFGNGIVSNFLEAYYAGTEPTPLKAALLLLRASLSALIQGSLARRLLRPVEARVSLDGVDWPAATYTAILAGTVDNIGLGFRPFYLAPSHPGWFHALGLACTPAGIVRIMPDVYRGLPTHNPDVHSRLAQTMRIEADRPMSYTVDGDFHGGGQVVQITVGPRIQLVTG